MASTQTMPVSQGSHGRRRLRNLIRRFKRRASPGSAANTQEGPTNHRPPIPFDRDNEGGPAQTSLEVARPTDRSAVQANNRLSRSLTDLAKTQSQASLPASTDDNEGRATEARSIAPTIATQPGTTHSDSKSRSGTFTTGGGALSTHELGGEGSTFSSPAPSERSLTTTLTTIQSTAPGTLLNAAGSTHQHHHGNPHHHNNASSTFMHQYPTTPTPASAVPPHLTSNNLHGSGHPHTYTTATANGVLTDDASVLTLASSTKRRRRNSLDTNASVRALAPNSIFGSSRESLPLSVLSANVSSQQQEGREGAISSASAGPGSNAGSMVGGHVMRGPNLAGTAAAERASVYSGSGIMAGTSGEGRETRSSYYANRAADGASIRSGLLGHARNDSLTGSIGGQASPLASPVVAEET